jgi:carbonic anhydrase/acetyltransferase-like protein (isoleucine patch superfamily)
VTEGKGLAGGSLIVGAPARLVRAPTPQQIAHLHWSARHCVDDARRHRASVKKIG